MLMAMISLVADCVKAVPQKAVQTLGVVTFMEIIMFTMSKWNSLGPELAVKIIRKIWAFFWYQNLNFHEVKWGWFFGSGQAHLTKLTFHYLLMCEKNMDARTLRSQLWHCILICLAGIMWCSTSKEGSLHMIAILSLTFCQNILYISKQHLINWNWSTQSHFINEMLQDIYTVFFVILMPVLPISWKKILLQSLFFGHAASYICLHVVNISNRFDQKSYVVFNTGLRVPLSYIHHHPWDPK